MRTLTPPASRAEPDGALRIAAACRLLLQAGSLLLAGSVQAQTAACDQLKGTLATRISSDPRSYTLEGLRADVPLPPGAKAVGTCEGGAYKIVMRRSAGGAAATAGSASTTEPSVTPKRVAEPQAKPAPGGQAAPTVRGARASAPADTPLPVSRSVQAGPADPIPPQGSTTASAGAASSAGSERERTVITAPAPLQRDEPPAAKGSVVQATYGFVARYWPWILAVTLLPIGRWVWVWLAHRRIYDTAGLPRGPKF